MRRAARKKKAFPPEVTASDILKRALLFKPRAVALVLIGEDGKPINMWHTGFNRMLELVGAAQNLAHEVCWSVPQDTRTKTFPKPKRPSKKKPPKFWPPEKRKKIVKKRRAPKRK